MDDFFIDDVLENLGRKEKKKVNSKDKGKRGERDLCAVFSERFSDKNGFFRVVGSGAHGHRLMAEQAVQVLTADIVCPEGFKFSVECKYGYADIDLCTCFDKGIKNLDDFLDQAEKDAVRVGKLPMLCWRKPRQNWLVFVKAASAPDGTYKLYYRDWVGMSLTELFKQPDSFFF